MHAALLAGVLAHLRELREHGVITPRQLGVLHKLEASSGESERRTPAEMADGFEQLLQKVDAGHGDEIERQRAAGVRYLWDHMRARWATQAAGDATGYAWCWRDEYGRPYWGGKNRQPLDLDAVGPPSIVDWLRGSV